MFLGKYKYYIDLGLLFSVTFIGDYTIGLIPLFPIFWFLVIARRNFSVSLSEIKIQVVIFLIFSPFYIHFTNFDVYNLLPIYIALYVNVLPLLNRVIFDSSPPKTLPVILGGVFILFFTLSYFVVSSGERAYVVFGPNILYRIYGFLFFVYVLNLSDNRISRREKITVIVMLVLFFLCSATTLSRGATFVIISVMLYVFFVVRIFSLLEMIGLGVLGLLLITFGLDFSFLSLFDRLLLFKESGNSVSISSRMQFYHDFIYYLDSDILGILFGLGSINVVYDYYPHNIFLEVFVYLGTVIGLFFVVGLLKSIFFSLFYKEKKVGKLIWLYSPVFIGANFSGGLLDHFYLLTIVFVVLLSPTILERNNV